MSFCFVLKAKTTFFTCSYLVSLFVSLLVSCCHLLSIVVTLCHSLSLTVSIFEIHFHSLYHSLLLVVTQYSYRSSNFLWTISENDLIWLLYYYFVSYHFLNIIIRDAESVTTFLNLKNYWCFLGFFCISTNGL